MKKLLLVALTLTLAAVAPAHAGKKKDSSNDANVVSYSKATSPSKRSAYAPSRSGGGSVRYSAPRQSRHGGGNSGRASSNGRRGHSRKRSQVIYY